MCLYFNYDYANQINNRYPGTFEKTVKGKMRNAGNQGHENFFLVLNNKTSLFYFQSANHTDAL